jgi:hypothetical protein
VARKTGKAMLDLQAMDVRGMKGGQPRPTIEAQHIHSIQEPIQTYPPRARSALADVWASKMQCRQASLSLDVCLGTRQCVTAHTKPSHSCRPHQASLRCAPHLSPSFAHLDRCPTRIVGGNGTNLIDSIHEQPARGPGIIGPEC